MTIFPFDPNTANLGDYIALGSIGFLLLVSLIYALAPAPKVQAKTETKKAEPVEPQAAKKEIPVQVEASWNERLKKGFGKTRNRIWGGIESIFSSGTQLDEDKLEQIEELLYTTDMGAITVDELIDHIKIESKKEDFSLDGLKEVMFNYLKEQMAPIQGEAEKENFSSHKGPDPKVIMIVGVNGAGKTTTIGKLATRLTGEGKKVFVGACDTFRAAAVEQLEVWCERAGATIVKAKDGADPSGVAYECLQQAKTAGADYCLIDTAGRLHTKVNLMEELKKNKRVLSKLDNNAPHHTWLVIDSITGQNAMKQAQEFHKTLNLSGLIFTKCDGSSKAGNAVSIMKDLQVPIFYIGVGESVEDLNRFSVDEYLNVLLDRSI